MNYRAFDPFRALVVLSFTVVSAAACSTNVYPADPGGSSGSAPVPTADCTSRCEAKATQCGAPSSKAEAGCNAICDGSYTSDQLACLEDKSCNELQSGSLANVCPRSSSSGSSSGGASSGGASSGGASSSGSSGHTTHYACSLNGQCFKCADSAGVKKCSISTGPGPGCTSTDSSYCER